MTNAEDKPVTPEPHKLQPDPPEGDPDTIDRELERQKQQLGDKDRKAMDEAAPQTGVRPRP